jgi:outer membrane protein OmpA-like peptidoglycan-associated protein
MRIKPRFLLGAALTATAIAMALYLDIIGSTMKAEPMVVNFSRGTSLSDGERERLIVFANKHLNQERLVFNVIGHSGQRGDTTANLALSQQRAKLVADELHTAGLIKDRIQLVEGVGSADPLLPNPDLSDNALQRAMARVVITSVVKK